MVIATMLASCQRKPLHLAQRGNVSFTTAVIDIHLDFLWGEHWKEDLQYPWNEQEHGVLGYTEPWGIRSIVYLLDEEKRRTEYLTRNMSKEGGRVNIATKEHYDMLFYNNDTEYILFQSKQDGNKATTLATTRTRTRATYVGSEFTDKDEETMTPPDMLYANRVEGYIPEKSIDPVPFPITLQPLVFTYKIRYEFLEEDGGLEYVAYANGALSGMAKSVIMDTGETSAEGSTILFNNCEITDYGVRGIVTSFGIPSFPNKDVNSRTDCPKNGLNLEVVLRNGKIINFNFDVTEQVQKQPHGGVIVVTGLQIKPEDGTQGSGAFDVDVNGWEETEDIYLPL